MKSNFSIGDYLAQNPASFQLDPDCSLRHEIVKILMPYWVAFQYQQYGKIWNQKKVDLKN